MNYLPKIAVAVFTLYALALGPQTTAAQDLAGTFFGAPVPKENYMFLLRTVLSYHSPWGGIPKDREQAHQRVWDELILSYEAHRRQINPTRDDVEIKIGETLKGEGVSFNWKEESQAYAQWAKDTLNAPVELFENQMKHLVQIKQLHDQVKDGINKKITDEEIYQEFLNENNSLSVELAEFDSKEEAQIFYELVKGDLSEWDKAQERDAKLIPEDRRFRKPGFVALEFLMDMWGFPKDAVFEMIEMNADDIYPPNPIYRGYGVFRVLEVRKADPARLEGRKERIIKQLEFRAKHDGFKQWLEQMRQKADVQAFVEPPEEIFP